MLKNNKDKERAKIKNLKANNNLLLKENEIVKKNLEELSDYKEENNRLIQLNEKISKLIKEKESKINSITKKLEENDTLIEEKNMNSAIEKEELESENQRLIYNNNSLFNIINKINKSISNNCFILNKYNEELEKINISFKDKNAKIELNEILTLIKAKTNLYNPKKNDIKEIKEDILTDEYKFDEFNAELNKKIDNDLNKYNFLLKLYIDLINKYNNKIKEGKNIINNLNKIKDNLHSEIIQNIRNISEDEEDDFIFNKKFGINDNSENIITYINEIINKISIKIKQKILNKDEEINNLHERIDYFIKEMKIIKQSNEALAKDKSSTYKIQKEKYENQIKIKEETIKKLEEYITKQNFIKEQDNKSFQDLQKKYKFFGDKFKEKNKKSEIKDASTGKFVIHEYMNKLREFTNGIYNFDYEDYDD